MYTQEEFEEDVAILEEEKHKVRSLVVAAAERNNPWRVDGIETLRRLKILDEMIERCEQKRKTFKFVIARSIEDKRVEKNKENSKYEKNIRIPSAAV